MPGKTLLCLQSQGESGAAEDRARGQAAPALADTRALPWQLVSDPCLPLPQQHLSRCCIGTGTESAAADVTARADSKSVTVLPGLTVSAESRTVRLSPALTCQTVLQYS